MKTRCRSIPIHPDREIPKGKMHNVADTAAHDINQGNAKHMARLQQLWEDEPF